MGAALAIVSAALFLICSVCVDYGSAVTRLAHNCSDLKLIPVNGVSPCVCTFNTSEPVDGALVWWVGNQVVATGRHGVNSLRFPSEKLSGYHLGIPKLCRVKFSDGSLSTPVRLPDVIAYGPENVTIHYNKANDTEGVQHIRVICDVSLFYPMTVNMIEWGGQCQGQEGVTCTLTPEEANGKEVRCRVTNFANNNQTVEATVNISVNGEMKSAWDEGSVILSTPVDKAEQQNKTGLKLLNCDGHWDYFYNDVRLVSLRPGVGLGPNTIEVTCEGLTREPGSSVHWTLTTTAGHTLDLGRCTGSRCWSNDLGFTLTRTGSRSTLHFRVYPRELNGVLTCAEQKQDGGSKSANCSFGYVYRAKPDGCMLTTERAEKWTVVIMCTVRHLYPLHAYRFTMTELHQNTMFGTPIPTHTPFPTPPVYLTTPYINDTDQRPYYSVVVVNRRPLPPVNDVFYSYQLTVNPGGSSIVSNPTQPLHVVRPAQLNISCSRSFHVIDHVLATSSRTCFCATTSVGSPAGRLLWFLGERVAARSQYGVTYLEFPIEEFTIPEEGMTITCSLDWIENQTTSMVIYRDDVSPATPTVGPGVRPASGGSGSIMKPPPKLPGVTETTGTTLDGKGQSTMLVLGVAVALIFIIIIVIVVVAVVVVVKWRRGQKREPLYERIPVSEEAFPAGSFRDRFGHQDDLPPDTGFRGIRFTNAVDALGSSGALVCSSNSSSSSLLVTGPHVYSSIPTMDPDVYEDIEDPWQAEEKDDSRDRHGRPSRLLALKARENRLRSRSAEDLRVSRNLYLTPVNDFYLTPVNDLYLTPVNDLYLTPKYDMYLTPISRSQRL